MEQLNEFLARLTELLREISDLLEVADRAALRLKGSAEETKQE